MCAGGSPAVRPWLTPHTTCLFLEGQVGFHPWGSLFSCHPIGAGSRTGREQSAADATQIWSCS